MNEGKRECRIEAFTLSLHTFNNLHVGEMISGEALWYDEFTEITRNL